MNERKVVSQRSLQKKAQICAAAQDLFLKQGFARTTMDEITQRAGVSKQTLYRYYSHKEALFIDILQQMSYKRVWQSVSVDYGEIAFTTRGELRQILVVIAQNLLQSLMQPEYLALIRTSIAEIPHFPHLAPLIQSSIMTMGMDNLMALFQYGQTQHIIDPVDPDIAVRFFIGPLLTYIILNGLLAETNSSEMPSDKRIETCVDFLMKAIT